MQQQQQRQQQHELQQHDQAEARDSLSQFLNSEDGELSLIIEKPQHNQPPPNEFTLRIQVESQSQSGGDALSNDQKMKKLSCSINSCRSNLTLLGLDIRQEMKESQEALESFYATRLEQEVAPLRRQVEELRNSLAWVITQLPSKPESPPQSTERSRLSKMKQERDVQHLQFQEALAHARQTC